MTSIPLLTIEGTISPSVYPSACSMEPTYPTPEINFVESHGVLEHYQSLNERFEEFFDPHTDLDFWKKRILTHMMVSPSIISVTFIPSDASKCQTLFRQKRDLHRDVMGFVAPYLCKKDRKECGAMATMPHCNRIDSEEAIDDSLIGLGPYSEALRPMLSYFLRDPQTLFIGITCLHKTGQPFSLGWIKV